MGDYYRDFVQDEGPGPGLYFRAGPHLGAAQEAASRPERVFQMSTSTVDPPVPPSERIVYVAGSAPA